MALFSITCLNCGNRTQLPPIPQIWGEFLSLSLPCEKQTVIRQREAWLPFPFDAAGYRNDAGNSKHP